MTSQKIRKDLILETCGQKKPYSHEKGCYIRFSNEKIDHSEPRNDAVIDYDKKGKVVGVEFYEGLGSTMNKAEKLKNPQSYNSYSAITPKE